MHIFKWPSLVIIASILSSCGPSTPTLDNFDHEVWKSDRYGCRGERIKMYSSLQTQKSKLLGLSEMEVVEVLGKPDQNELYKRNQKFYYYFLAPSEKCAEPSASAKRVALRFNAVGLLKEISEE